MFQLKNDFEVNELRTGGKLLAQLFDELNEFIKSGMSTYDINQYVIAYAKKHHCKPSVLGYQGFTGACCTSINEEVIHGIPSKKKIIQEGDLISVDICLTYNNLITDSTRTYEIGKVEPKVHKLNIDTKKALDLGIEAAGKKGARLQDISKAIFRKTAIENGYGVVREYAGHGVGFSLHEEPSVINYVSLAEANPRLKPGLVLAIEPMINLGTYRVKVLKDNWTVVTLDNSVACHWEHTVVITENGAEILTQ